ncbi:MAG: pitrilysin family protein [Chloroflexia bacterium]
MTAQTNDLLLVEKLPNGLTVVGQRMPGIESVAMCFHVKTGSRHESAEVSGVSHFLEHMMFKGTATRSAIDISKEFEQMGAEFNAFTWVESTVYYARVLGDQVPKALAVLADMMRPKLDEGEFTMEKGVIIEEIARSEDQPTHELIHDLFATFFGDYPLGASVLGTPDTIKNMTIGQMRDYYTNRYSPNNMILGVAGAFDPDTLLKLVRERTADWTPQETARSSEEFRPQPHTEVKVKSKLQQEHVAIACPRRPRATTKFGPASRLGARRSSGSRLFWEVTQKGLADSVDTDYYGFDGAGMFLTYFSASPERAPEVLTIVRGEMEKLEREGVTVEELERAKVKAVSGTVIGGEASTRRMFEVTDLYISHGRAMSVDEIVAKIEAVTVEDVRRVLDAHPFSASFTLQAAGPLAEAELLG